MPDHNNNTNDWEMYQPDLTADHPRHQRLLEPLISLYQDGEADEEETAKVEQYLSACAECRAINAGFQRLNGNLTAYMEAIPAPAFNRQNYPFLDETPARGATTNATAGRQAAFSGNFLTDDRNLPVQRRRARFAYNLAGVMAAVFVVGLVGVFLLLIVQQVNQSNNNSTETVAAVGAVQTQAAAQTQTPQVESSPTAATTSPATQPPATATPEPTNQPDQTGLATAAIPETGNAQPGPTLTAQTPGAIQKTPPSATQRPAPTNTAVPVPTNTPVPSRTTVAPTATTAPQPTVAPSAAASPEVTTAPAATTAVTTAPVETTAATVETTTVAVTTVLPAVTVTPATPTPATPNETSSNARGWIAYVDQSDGQIHLVKADGKDDQVISDPTVNSNLVYENLVWSNNGKLLVAVGQNTNNGSRSIFLLDISNPLRVEELAVGFAPTFSPDNQAIAFLAGPATVKAGVLYGKPAIYSLTKRTITTVNTLADSFRPQWFADSTRLLIGQDRIYDSDSAVISTFKLPFTNTCLAAALSPTGDRLANLELQADGSYQTVVYDLSKGTLDPKKPLAKASGAFQGKIGLNCGTQRLNWTPNSRNVYYYVNGGSTAATCLVQANGGGSRCLTNVYEPSFNSDGSALVDSSPTSGGAGQVYTADATVSARPPRPHLIAESVVPPVWQPL